MRSALAFAEQESDEIVNPPRYGEAASYRTSRWLQAEDQGGWVASKKRELSPFLLLKTLAASQAILELADDWDEMGSPAIKRITWERAVNLVTMNAAALWDRTGIVMPPPRVLPGPDGSIDLHWKTLQRELLVNVPEDSADTISYYGDNFENDKRRGGMSLSSPNLELFSWLTMID